MYVPLSVTHACMDKNRHVHIKLVHLHANKGYLTHMYAGTKYV